LFPCEFDRLRITLLEGHLESFNPIAPSRDPISSLRLSFTANVLPFQRPAHHPSWFATAIAIIKSGAMEKRGSKPRPRPIGTGYFHSWATLSLMSVHSLLDSLLFWSSALGYRMAERPRLGHSVIDFSGEWRQTYVQPRTMNSTSNIGTGTPIAHNRIQPIAPVSFSMIFDKIFIIPPKKVALRAREPATTSAV
jgi:hypothetical protein